MSRCCGSGRSSADVIIPRFCTPATRSTARWASTTSFAANWRRSGSSSTPIDGWPSDGDHAGLTVLLTNLTRVQAVRSKAQADAGRPLPATGCPKHRPWLSIGSLASEAAHPVPAPLRPAYKLARTVVRRLLGVPAIVRSSCGLEGAASDLIEIYRRAIDEADVASESGPRRRGIGSLGDGLRSSLLP